MRQLEAGLHPVRNQVRGTRRRTKSSDQVDIEHASKGSTHAGKTLVVTKSTVTASDME
jgi:hypothetical protein